MTGSTRRMHTGSDRRFGFTLIELLVVIAIIALLVSILLPALAKSRKFAKIVLCNNQQRQMSIAQLTYSTDFKDALSAFSWLYGKWGPEAAQAGIPFNPTANDLEAASAQAVAWMRLFSAPRNTAIPVPGGWVPHIRYSHIPLYHYLAKRLPEPGLVCPEDYRQIGYINNPSVPAAIGGVHQVYASSYNFTPAFYTPDKETPDGGRFRQGSSHRIFDFFPGSGPTANQLYKVGRRRSFEVKNPSQKVWIFDEYDRHTQKVDTYFTHYRAQPTVIMADGSTRTIRSHEANLGGYTTSAGFQTANAAISYAPNEFPLVPWPDTSNMVQDGRFRWTLGGLKGRDVGGARGF